ncbi:DUF4082 domain-containing protein [Rhizobium giardinii]|uniref:Ca2+-binding RTX toxin-like protein n=1 Tax=Rhizobium giardinii TaxID=56731 RepID=A0A7W8U8I2_9HYPH|nr:Ca2+-binding RTX toxin-like protein [Rhizobium giardinii]
MTHTREIAFIDPAVTDFETLVAGLRPDVEPVVLSRDEPALAQMARMLEGRANLDAIHVIAHGRPGELSFAAGAVSYETIKDDAAELPAFGAALGTEKALLVWACETGAEERGAAFVDTLAARAGVRILAASGIVGSERCGGTWSLDRGVGAGRPPLSAEGMIAYAGIMATFTGTSGTDRANATTGTLTGFTGGTVAQLQDASGDTFNGGGGADEIVAGSGDDTINLGAGQFVAGESIEGGANSASGTRDQIVLTAGGTTNLSVGTVSGIETLTGNTSSDTVTMTATQWAGFATIDLGSGLLTTDVLNVLASGNISALTMPTVSNVETGNLTGTSGTDTVTLSGTQLNAILIGSGTVNLGSGTGDTINLTSTSSDLNTLGATDGSIQGVEAVSASGAATGVTIALGGQSEAIAITGSAQADTLTGGSGGNTIVGGGGADTISGGAGNDTITYDGSDVSIAGGTNTDTLVVTGAVTISLASADQSSGDTANTTGFENVNASGSSAAVSLTGDGNANTLTGGAGADTIVGGAGADTLNGGAGNDTITYDGSDVSIAGGANTDTLVVTGAVTINLASADQSSGDTANTTGFENVTASGASAAVNLTGDGNANTLTGGAGADTIVGGAGADTLDGGAGNDTVTYDGSDVSIAGGANTDTLVVTGAATINLASADQSSGDTANTTGFENVNASASSAAVSLTGDGNANIFTGGGGADTIIGGAGVDTLAGGAGNDLVTYDASDVSIGGGADIDTLLVNGAATINLSSADQSSGDTANTTGFENVNASGSSAAVSLTGASGANVLTGGSANDTLNGGGGNDTIDGGAGTGDTVIFSGARANYTISLSGVTYTIADTRSGSPDGADTVTGVENFQFSDGTRTASQLNPTAQNKIVLENLKQGNPISEWGIDGSGSGNIQGFATEISTNIGQTVSFKIATDSANYRIEIYRLGYYGGDGARKVATVDVNLASAQVQPHPIVDMSRGLIDAGNWAVSASWAIPSDAVSGVYIAKLVREDGTVGASHIPFIVRDDNAASDIVFQTSDTTWQAYNEWGGASLYFGDVPVDPANLIGYLPPNCGCGVNSIGRATAVSYNRPFVTNTSVKGGTHDFIFGAEHSAIRWLEQNGYDVSYISGVDATRSGSLLLNHEAYLSVGHDEYWSAEQRTNVEAARDAGVDLAFWSGNEVYWKVRWETSIDGNGTPYRTMVCYKETWGGTPDPTSTGTGTWRDPRFADPGQEPENSLTGTMFTVDSYRLDTITIPYDYSNLRFWRNTDVAELQPGQTFSLVQNLLGYEWDSDVENGYRPAGLINMSLSTVSVNTYLRDYGTSIGSADVTHSLTMYRAESGALVFGAGTVFWSWGLDSNHEGAATPTDPNVQQAMVNMFADMGIQPGTLDASLILATQSTDTVKPTSTITSPSVGASFLEGQKVTVTGTAQDTGGGIVAGVEVSLDGGQSWWKATGRESWSYSWVVQASGTYTIMSRAVDDSLNLGNPSPSTQVTVNLPSTSSLWTLASKPQVETNLDRDGVELGVRFQASTDGVINGIRFYKGFYNVGQHVVSLWTSTGTRIATGTSSGESITGWQTVTFSNPVRITPGTTYVASYHTGGYYSSSDTYFSSSYTNGLLNVQPGGGVYAYSADNNGAFPGNSSNANYWVDVVFTPDPNQGPTAVADSGFSVGKDGMLPISFTALLANDTDPNNDPMTVSAVGNATNGTVTLDTQTGNVIFTPNTGYSGPASFTYTASDQRGGTSSATVTLTVEQDPAGVSLFQWTEGPTGAAVVDTAPLELGMKFTASVVGTITGIRFYKPANATGAHTGSLWSSTGTLLATVNFTNESTSGWQTATFSNPVAITAGTTYVASYHTTGVYAATANYFNSAKVNGSLTAPSSSASGGNGVYTYSSGTAFPTSSFQAANYWVDVVYKRSTVNTVPIASNDNGFTVSNSNSLSIAAATLLANDNDADSDPLTITGVGGATNGTVAFNSQANTVTFTPTSGYIGPASFSYSIADGRGGTASAVVSLTVGQSETTLNLFSPSNAPSLTSVNDPEAVELGVKFVASSAGLITGLRYYKSAQDTGTHTGSLWTSGGNLLASATFANESASGWQTVTFTQPVSISAGTTYVASYHSNGFYGVTPNFFATSYTNGPLSAPSSAASGGNGVHAYGAGGLFPSASYNATNYWVDVLYEQATGNLSPVALDDSGFSTQTDTVFTVQASTLLANDSDPNGDPMAITGVGNAVNGTVAFNSQSNAVTFTPTSGYTGSASFTYSVSDGQGGTDTGLVSLNVVPQDQQNLFSSSATPTTVTENDSADVNLGMKFQADVAGWITGFRFYKGPSNTGPHTGYLWTSTGTLLASASFTNESSSGWQSVSLAQQVAIQANTTYVVSYSTNGFYSATGNFFGSEVSNGNLHALSSALSGGNGVYAYGSAGLFPTNSYNSSNYYVDVAFRPQLAA